MRKIFPMSFLAALALALVGCGGSDDAFQNPDDPDPNAPVVGALTLTTSTPTLPTDGSLSADIRAFVQDENNVAMEGVTVSFSADAGVINVTQAVTGTDGVATATLTASPSNKANQTLTVTAVAGTAREDITVNTVGTRLSLQGPSSAVLQQNNDYVVNLIDSGDAGISGIDVTVASSQGNSVSSSTVTTDVNGKATFTVTTDQPGDDTITVSALGLNSSQQVAVNTDSFTVITPASDGVEVNLNTARTITVRWLTDNNPVVGQTVAFATTRGTLSAPTAVTNGSGDATVTVQSTTAGAGTITATGTGVTAQRTVEFIAITAAAIDVQPGIFTLAPNEETTLTAIVRDAAGNLVKNKLVNFNVQDVTGGSLSVASATTNSQGRAQSVYTAGATTSATDGVLITVSVTQGASTLTDTVALTVARKELFISLGTGNEIEEPNQAQYKIQYVIQMTDSSGNGVPNVPLVVSIVSDRYYKGVREFNGTNWLSANPLFGPCADEDINHNGVLDAGEDFNGSTRVEAGNIALVTPSNVVTNDQGIVLVDVLYPQDHAYWVDVTLEASASVQGTEFKRASHFLLQGSTEDFNTEDTAPPGVTSPFGVNACNQPD